MAVIVAISKDAKGCPCEQHHLRVSKFELSKKSLLQNRCLSTKILFNSRIIHINQGSTLE